MCSSLKQDQTRSSDGEICYVSFVFVFVPLVKKSLCLSRYQIYDSYVALLTIHRISLSTKSTNSSAMISPVFNICITNTSSDSSSIYFKSDHKTISLNTLKWSVPIARAYFLSVLNFCQTKTESKKQKTKTNIYSRRKWHSHWCHSPCADRSVRSHNLGRIDVAENVKWIEFPGNTAYLQIIWELIMFANLKKVFTSSSAGWVLLSLFPISDSCHFSLNRSETFSFVSLIDN